MELYAVAEESARLGSASVCKFVCIGGEEAGKLVSGSLGLLRKGSLALLGNAPRLSLLGSASRAPPSRGLQRNPTRRPRRSGGARCGPSDDRISAPIEVKFEYCM
ncbi:hypothetical protein GW17_00000683 [Ensete ventricosum]|nr:hypothetical protein GW17_00000683 [Ensete ventricosum]RZR90141.1 hypothetical protein BHM03_00017956 [Ensete ventricosum]